MEELQLILGNIGIVLYLIMTVAIFIGMTICRRLKKISEVLQEIMVDIKNNTKN